MSSGSDEQVLMVDGLAKTFRIGFLRRRVVAVKNSTFDVKKGEIFGLVGPNGAGKTTTIKMLMGLITPDSGSATIHGVPIGDVASRARVGYLPETPHFYDYLRPDEFLRYFGALYRMDKDAVEARIPGLLDRVGLGEARDKQLRKFSKGMLQRIGLAQALLPDSDFVLLDEPQSGLDPMGRKDVRDLILELRDAGKTVLFSSHILHDVEQICDRVAIIVRGLVTKVGPLDELVDQSDSGLEVVLRGGQESADPWPDGVTAARTPSGDLRLTCPPELELAPLLAAASNRGWEVREVLRHRRNLEDIFIEEAAAADARAAAEVNQ